MREVFWAGVSTLTEEIQTVQRDGLKMKVVMALLLLVLVFFCNG